MRIFPEDYSNLLKFQINGPAYFNTDDGGKIQEGDGDSNKDLYNDKKKKGGKDKKPAAKKSDKKGDKK